MDEESKPPHPDQKSRVALPFQDSDQIQTKQSTQQNSGERNRFTQRPEPGFQRSAQQ